MRFFISILVICMVALHGSSYSYGQDSPHIPSLRLGAGYHTYGYGNLPTLFLEFQPLRRVSLEPSVSVLPRFVESVSGAWGGAAWWRYSGALDFKYYRFLNRRHPMEGIYFHGHLDYYRSIVYAQRDEYTAFRGYGTDAGIGIGGQYYFWKRLSLDARWSQNWGYTTSYWYDADGSPRYVWKDRGFRWRIALQIGFTF